MPKRKKKRGKKNKDQRLRIIALWSAFALALASLLLAACMALEARIVHLRFSDITLRDLPRAFDGAKILYLTDLHMDGFRAGARVEGLLRQLLPLEPDMVLLGGDYSSIGFAEMLLSFGGSDALSGVHARMRSDENRLFSALREFSAPLGIYGGVGEADEDFPALSAAAESHGIQILKNSGMRIERDGTYLYIAALDDWTSGGQDISSLAALFSEGDCVILLSHTPDAFPSINNQPAPGGGQFADLVLSGHTHGGQITLFGDRPLFPGSIYGTRYLAGWYHESGTQMLVSRGVGTHVLPLRLGSAPEAHLITLRASASENFD